MENVSNRELLTANDGHAVMQTTGADWRQDAQRVRVSATSHRETPGLPGGVIRGGGLHMEAKYTKYTHWPSLMLE